VPEHIDKLVPYAPGKPISEVQRELGLAYAIKLASNENPLGPSPKARDAVERAAAQMHFYPDGGCYYLRAALAEAFDVRADELLLGNGSNELIELLIHAFVLPGTHMVTSASTFVIYKLATQAMGRTYREAPLGPDRGYDMVALAQAVDRDTRLVFIANPNNPTGTHIGAGAMADFVTEMDARAGDDPPVLVLDEAYHEYVDAPDAPDSMALLRRRPRTVILRTFSKAYGLAGIRCGYGFTSPEIVDRINRIRAPFNVNSLAQVAAIAALQDDEFLARAVQVNREGKAWLQTALTARGLGVTPSQTNFLLVDFQTDAKTIFEALMAQGVITRPMGGYGLPSCLRISVGLAEQNAKLIEAIDMVLGGTSA
jgi:histidinol-phosphate aminotransferase